MAKPEAGPSTPPLKKNFHPRPTQVKAKGKKRAVTEPVSNGETDGSPAVKKQKASHPDE